MNSDRTTRKDILAATGAFALAATLVVGLVFAVAAWAQYCPGDCTGGPGADTLSGSGNGQKMEGRGSGDSIYGYGGTDNLKGEGGAGDRMEAGNGNGDRAAGGTGTSDDSIVWGDSGTDYAYGGQHLNDRCYVDVNGGNDQWDGSCEVVKKT